MVGVAAASRAILLGYCAWWMAARAAKRKFRGRWWWNFFRRRARMLPMNIFRFIHMAAGARAATQHDEPDAKREIAKMGSRRLMPMCCCSAINKLFFVLAWFMQRIDIILIIMCLCVREPMVRIKSCKRYKSSPQGSSNTANTTKQALIIYCNK